MYIEKKISIHEKNPFLSHVLREGNKVTDILVNYGLSLDRQMKFFDVVPSFISNVVMANIISARELQ